MKACFNMLVVQDQYSKLESACSAFKVSVQCHCEWHPNTIQQQAKQLHCITQHMPYVV